MCIDLKGFTAQSTQTRLLRALIFSVSLSLEFGERNRSNIRPYLPFKFKHYGSCKYTKGWSALRFVETRGKAPSRRFEFLESSLSQETPHYQPGQQEHLFELLAVQNCNAIEEDPTVRFLGHLPENSPNCAFHLMPGSDIGSKLPNYLFAFTFNVSVDIRCILHAYM
jgi:hypothetical protein